MIIGVEAETAMNGRYQTELATLGVSQGVSLRASKLDREQRGDKDAIGWQFHLPPDLCGVY